MIGINQVSFPCEEHSKSFVMADVENCDHLALKDEATFRNMSRICLIARKVNLKTRRFFFNLFYCKGRIFFYKRKKVFRGKLF